MREAYDAITLCFSPRRRYFLLELMPPRRHIDALPCMPLPLRHVFMLLLLIFALPRAADTPLPAMLYLCRRAAAILTLYERQPPCCRERTLP